MCGYTLLALFEATIEATRKELVAIVLWQEGSGRWRWAYREGDVEIMSNHPYRSEAEARAAAALAYPDAQLPATVSSTMEDDPRRPGPVTLLLSITALWRWYRRARHTKS